MNYHSSLLERLVPTHREDSLEYFTRLGSSLAPKFQTRLKVAAIPNTLINNIMVLLVIERFTVYATECT
jgi:hypothetical protein